MVYNVEFTQKTTLISPVASGRWKIIAKNKMKVWTSKFRHHRPAFFIVMTGIVSIIAFIGVPALMAELTENLWYIGGSLLPLVSYYVEYIYSILFFLFFLVPISSVLQNFEGERSAIIMSTPIQEGEIFFGEFIGKSPIYFWCIMIFGTMVSNLIGLLYELSFWDHIIIIITLLFVVFLGVFTSMVVSRALLNKLLKLPHGKDLGKALGLFVAFLFFIPLTILQSMGQKAALDLTLRKGLQSLPPVWLANIVNTVIGAEPLVYWMTPWLSGFFAMAYGGCMIYLGKSFNSNPYPMERDKFQATAKVKPDKWLLRTIQRVMPNRWATLMVIHIKTLMRRKENAVKFLYSTIFIFFMTFVYRMAFENGVISSVPGGYDFFIAVISILLMPLMGSMVLSINLGTMVFIQNKDCIWVYKQSPRGIGALIKTNIITHFLYITFLAIIVWIFNIQYLKLSWWGYIAYFSLILALFTANFIFTQSVQAINPVFTDKSGKMTINIVLSVIIQMTGFMTMFIMYMDGVIENLMSTEQVHQGLLIPLALFTGLMSILAAILYKIGFWRMNKLE